MLDVATFSLQSGTTCNRGQCRNGEDLYYPVYRIGFVAERCALQEILVVTFTEVATKELADRLQSFLTKVHSELSLEGLEDLALKPVLTRAIAANSKPVVARQIQKAMLDIDQASIFDPWLLSPSASRNAFAANASWGGIVCGHAAYC